MPDRQTGAMPTLPDLLNGPLPALPRRLDDAARWWRGLPPRPRLALAALALLVLLAGPGLRTAASPYGAAMTVVVTAHELPAGHLVTAGDLTASRWPGGLAADAVTAADVVGRRLRHGIPAGAVVRRGHVAGFGIAALLGAGQAGLAVAIDEAPPLQVGDGVDVQGPDVATAADGVVIAIDADVVWLALPRAAAARLAAAASRGPLSLTVLPS